MISKIMLGQWGIIPHSNYCFPASIFVVGQGAQIEHGYRHGTVVFLRMGEQRSEPIFRQSTGEGRWGF